MNAQHGQWKVLGQYRAHRVLSRYGRCRAMVSAIVDAWRNVP